MPAFLKHGAGKGLVDQLEARYRQRLRSALERSSKDFPRPPLPQARPESAPALFNALRRYAHWYVQLARIYGLAVDGLARAGSLPGARAQRTVDQAVPLAPLDEPTPEPHREAVDDAVAALLSRAQRLLLKYPVAAQAAFASLVAEGRAYAQTPEGARYERSLRSSRALSRQWLLTEQLSGGLLTEDPHVILPTSYVDMFVHAAATRPLGALLGQVRKVEDHADLG